MKIIPSRSAKGFTLIELLVAISIIAILSGLLLPVVQGAREKGKMIKEMNAAKQLIMAYSSYSASNDGELMLGYDKTVQDVTLPSGAIVSGEMCCRYPWRLAPYLAEQIEEVFLVNDNKKMTNVEAKDSFLYKYRASLNPALGINGYCVGGYDDGTGSGYFSGDVVRRQSAAVRASDLIVFASARMKTAGQTDGEVAGNFLVTPPHLWRNSWADKYDANADSSSFGNLALRWEGKAICAFLDGHVDLLGEEQLKDMRHWSNGAAEADNPEYVVQR